MADGWGCHPFHARPAPGEEGVPNDVPLVRFFCRRAKNLLGVFWRRIVLFGQCAISVRYAGARHNLVADVPVVG